MKIRIAIFLLIFSSSIAIAADQIPNKLIDYKKFSTIVVESASERESHRLSEKAFLTAISEDNVILLDARSSNRFVQRHIKGAINLPFTDFTADSLAKIIPSKDTKILIYCNNNFRGDPVSLASKAPAASLNLSTYTSLKAYGYKNIFELGPLLDVHTTSIPFEGSLVK